MASEAQLRAQAKYDAKATKQIKFKFNLTTDADILEKLDSVDNKQGYIKELIRADINGQAAALEKKIIAGEFKEGERVTVMIDGHEFTRIVKYSKELNELAIVAFTSEFGQSEFVKAD